MKLIHLLVISVLVLASNVADAKWDLEKILSICDDNSCDIPINEEMNKYSGSKYNEKLIKYITGGVSDILWNNIRTMTNAKQDANNRISSQCMNSLVSVTSDAQRGLKYSFEMIASTGKTPELLSQSTLTSLGDYDTCLSIDSTNYRETNADIFGKYCLVDMFPIVFSNKTKEMFSLEKVTIFKYFPFKTGICLPSSCTDGDIKQLLIDSMRDYPLIVKGDFDCDTRESVSWLTKIKNLNIHQIVSLLFLSTVLIVTSVATYYHVIALYIFGDENIEKNDLLMCLSCWSNMRKLVTKTKDKNTRFMVIDSLKLFTVFVGTLSHFMVALEIPNGYLLLDRHVNMNVIFSKAIAQTLMNENGLTIFAFLGGFLMFVSLYPVAKAGKISYITIIFFRYIHFIPSLLCLTAAEFIWTFLFDGPFYMHVSKFVLEKCTKNWWRNLFFIQNLYPSLETCAGHTFSMATDFQLFLYGLLTIYLLSKNKNIGLYFAGIASVTSYVVLSYRAIKYETTGTIYTPYPTPIKIVEYLQFIYMTTEAYIPSYMLGLYIGYLYDSGYKLKINSLYDHAYYMGIAGVLQNMVSVINGLANEFNLIPPSLTFLQIVANRCFFSVSIALVMIYFLSLDSIYGISLDRIESTLITKKRDANNNVIKEDAKLASEKNISNISGKEEDKDIGQANDDASVSTDAKVDAKVDANVASKANDSVEYSFFTALTRLSYAIFLTNYLLVKYEFFTSRSLVTLDWYPLLKRLTGSMRFCILFAFTFWCFFIAPWEALNKRYINRTTAPKKPKQKSN